jgi:flagellar protein FliO/FliZ
MDYALYLRALVSLAFVLALLLACFWALKKLRLFQGTMGQTSTRRLRIIETLPIDGRHRAILFRRDSIEHLVLIGPTSTTLIESCQTLKEIAP